MHYLKSFLNFYIKHNVLSILTILGLSFGVFSALLLGVQVLNEYSYNKSIKSIDNIYRIVSNNEGFIQARVPYIFPEIIKKEVPEVEKTGILISLPNNIGASYYVAEGEKIELQEFYVADEGALQILNIKPDNSSYTEIKHGELAISNSLAIKIFGKTSVIGELLPISHKGKVYNFDVCFVYSDVVVNQTHRPEIICNPDFYVHILQDSYKLNKDKIIDSFDYYLFEGIIERNPNTNEDDFVKKFEQTSNKIFSDHNLKTTISLQNFEDVYLDSAHIKNDFIDKGNRNNIQYYQLSMLVIILFTCFNFIVLSISITTKRNTEIGIRKVFGASRSSLFKQFLGESFLITFISLPIVVLFYIIYRIFLSQFFVLKFELFATNVLQYIIWIFLVLIILSVLSSIYTGVYLSSLSPIDTIYGKNRNKSKSKHLYLVLSFQIILSFILLSLSGTFYYQIDFALNKAYPFNIEKVQLVYAEKLLKDKDYQIIKNELLKDSKITNVTGGFLLPPTNSSSANSHTLNDNNMTSVVCELHKINSGFFEFYDIDFINGREFDYESESDIYNSCIINKKALESYNITNIDKLRIDGRTIVGVVENFNFHSLYYQIKPMIFIPNNNSTRTIALKSIDDNFIQQRSRIELVLKKLFNNKLFKVESFEFAMERNYEKDINLLFTMLFFTSVLMLLSIFGIVAITLFISQKEQKNTCIHLVYGAEPKDVYKIYLKRIIILLSISTIIAVPFALRYSYLWLNTFTSHINIPIQLIFIYLFFWLLICSICLFVLVKTVNMNPTKYLN
jgi:putative ABC transport system permease protein